MSDEYYYLEAGDQIWNGDECELIEGWRPAHLIGETVKHGRYRRRIAPAKPDPVSLTSEAREQGRLLEITLHHIAQTAAFDDGSSPSLPKAVALHLARQAALIQEFLATVDPKFPAFAGVKVEEVKP